MKFYDLHAETVEHNIQQMADFAERLGYSGLAICNSFENIEKLKELKNKISETESNIEVFSGAVIHAKNPQEMNDLVNKVREHVLIVIVAGGDYNINRAACENSKVNILATPEKQRKDSGFDHVMAKLAAENKVAVELCFRDYLHAYKKIRSYVLTHMRRNAMLAQSFDVALIVTSGAENIWDMRAGRELATLASACGIEREKAVRTVTDTAKWIIDRVKAVKSPEHVTAGVEIAKDE